jgi:hypothetical protein
LRPGSRPVERVARRVERGPRALARRLRVRHLHCHSGSWRPGISGRPGRAWLPRRAAHWHGWGGRGDRVIRVLPAQAHAPGESIPQIPAELPAPFALPAGPVAPPPAVTSGAAAPVASAPSAAPTEPVDSPAPSSRPPGATRQRTWRATR